MSRENKRMKQTVRFLKWIRRHKRWWYLICTPDEGNINPNMMRTLIERLYKESFYEIIFVLLMVHRKNHCMDDFFGHMCLESLIASWEGDKENIIKTMTEYFE